MKSKVLFLFCVILTFLIISEAKRGPKRKVPKRTNSPQPVQTTTEPPPCSSNNSPARECFDHYKLAVFWTPGYALQKQVSKDKRRRNLDATWMIHGLWPSMNEYGEKVTRRCSHNEKFFVDRHLDIKNGQQTLKKQLEATWHSIVHKSYNSRTDIEFWDYEFKQHGKCACRTDAIHDDTSYFTNTYNLFEDVMPRITRAFKNSNYNPGTAKKLKDIVKIIRNEINVDVDIRDYYHSDTKLAPKGNYLSEIRICYNFTLHLIDCPYINNKQINVIYLKNFAT